MSFLEFLLFLILIYAILASSYALLIGEAQQFSIAQAALWGAGAYAAAITTVNLGLPLWVAYPASAGAGALLGAIIALPSLRISGVYLAVASFSFQIIFVNLLNNVSEVTGGVRGISGVPMPGGFYPLSSLDVVLIATAMLAIVFIACTVVWRRGQYGRLLVAVGRDEDLVEGLGRDVRWLKMEIFALTGGVAGLAGALYAQYISYIAPSSFTVDTSINLLAMTYIGGARTTAGPIVGALFFVLVPEAVRLTGLPSSFVGAFQQVIFSGLLIVFLMFRPNGIVATSSRQHRAADPMAAASSS